MDTRPVDYLRHRLVRFAAAIEETREHAGELSAFGRYSACSPFYERSGIPAVLDSLTGDSSSFGDLLQEFRELDSRLEALGQDLGESYRCRLLEELTAYVDRYHAAVCMEHIGLITFGSDHELFCRDRIAVLVHELEKDHDLREIKNLILMLDRNLFSSGKKGDGETPAGPLNTGEGIPPRSEEEKIKS
jgi:hypothetical protein